MSGETKISYVEMVGRFAIGDRVDIINTYFDREGDGVWHNMGDAAAAIKDDSALMEQLKEFDSLIRKATKELVDDPHIKGKKDVITVLSAKKDLQCLIDDLTKVAAEQEKPKRTPEEQAEWDKKVNDEAMTILTTGEPMKYMLDEVGKAHIGDTWLAEGMILSAACTMAGNTQGLHPTLSGESGKGKTHCAKAVYHILPSCMKMACSVSPKALYYAELMPGTVVFLDDLQTIDEALEETIKKSSTNYQEDTIYKTLTKDKVAIDLHIPKRTVWWITSVDNAYDSQMLNRQLQLQVDTSKEQDDKILEWQLKMAVNGDIALAETFEVDVCRRMFEILRETDWKVMIPYAQDIIWNNAENRRNIDMFLDTIRCYAILSAFQRENDGNTIVASRTDFNKATGLWKHIMLAQISKLTRQEMQVVDAIVACGRYATVNQISERTGLPLHKVRDIINGREGKGGLLSKCSWLIVEDQNVSRVSEWKTDEYGREHPVEHTGRPKKMYHVTEEYSRWEQYENLVSLKAETA